MDCKWYIESQRELPFSDKGVGAQAKSGHWTKPVTLHLFSIITKVSTSNKDENTERENYSLTIVSIPDKKVTSKSFYYKSFGPYFLCNYLEYFLYRHLSSQS